MKKLDICLSPDLLKLYALEGKIAIIVDILRATSCMVAGLGSGVKSIMPFADQYACEQMKKQNYVIAGERNGEKIEGFDIGNSPFSFMEQKNKAIAMTTTNGTQAISMAKNAHTIIIGAFLNLSAVKNFVLKQDKDLLIICAGWKGRFSMEDSLFAGALAEVLEKDFFPEDDSVLAAKILYKNSKSNILEALKEGSHYQRLKRLNLDKDIEFCTKIDIFDVVPILNGSEICI
ncbi:MAG: 2-phosphosulfolactate phosphatase [Bacteroidetes bacterium]|nr:MAG: 2-phosphosulfolactate phosphatase [Bacteroidota bacterium]